MRIFYRKFAEFLNLKKKCNIMIFISCFSKLLYIVNISSYKKEQLKLHRSFLGV